MRPQKDLIFGLHSVIEAIHAGKEFEKVFFKAGLTGKLFHELFALVRENNIPFQYVPLEKLNLLTRGNHQGVVAYISKISYHDISQLLPGLYESGKSPLILVLDGITDTRNFGSIARIAECAGVNAIVVPTRNAASITADAIKTSSGALHTIPVCRSMNLKQDVLFLKESGLQIIAATEKASVNYYGVDFSFPTAIILGSEEKGISSEILKLSDKQIKIPILGSIDSLNVSAATAIIVYEAVRQRLN